MSSPIPPDGSNTWTVDALDNNPPTHSKTSTPPGFVASGLWPENNAAATNKEGDATASSRQRNEMTSSYNNIAAALGNGLAESMEDATRGDHLSKSQYQGDLEGDDTSNVPSNLTDSFFNPSNNNDMTYERQKRHAASRLLGSAGGSSSSPISHQVPDAGSLFGALEPSQSPSPSFSKRHNANHTDSDINNRKLGGHRSIGMESAPTSSSPFSHDPNAAAFHPSYEKAAISSSLQFNNNRSKSPRDIKRNEHCNSRLPVTKDLGLTVMEPSDTSYGNGGASNISSLKYNQYSSSKIGKTDVDNTYGIQADMQNLNLWSESGSGRGVGGTMSLKTPSSNRSVERNEGVALGEHLGSTVQGAINVEDELRPYTWDRNHHEPSRTLAIFNASSIQPNDIISVCENFGVTEAFRSEFLDILGVVFISFYDMRCAQFAAMQLPTVLERLAGGGVRVQVKFCVPLNSSSQNDESLVVINDLPHQISSESLGRLLSSYGAIRSLKNLEGGNYVGSFVAEFHDIQDARKVVFELESTQPWGPDVSIEVGGRNPTDRKKGRELLAMLGRWRNQGGVGQARPLNRGRQTGKAADTYRSHTDSRNLVHRDGIYERGFSHEDQNPHHGFAPVPQDGRYPYGNNTYVVRHQHSGYPQYRGVHHPNDNLVHGSHAHHAAYNRPLNHQQPPRQQQFYQQHQQISHGNFVPGGSSVISGGSSRHTGNSGYYTDDRSIGSHNSNLRSVNSIVNSMAGDTRDGQSQHLVLDLDAVENGLDTRTSLMVRNIPNKYTQQMLLTEFTENDHGPGIIDFFYLPIDFKNRCNRGYAFINFVDYHDILNFHRQYYGQHWRTFNSDKICDITYARIQGKAAMLKRFENSALMEKDEEYKPLVFVSSGPDRGTRLPFPDSSRA
mmetsp:Transcript_21950/g.52243  ORF Transcript_21950/g.52243 Transcript_21950/m.52243 type:complete len:897 (-) Transcript_21950:143-2833(-)|eukprot:CAMPEP_0197185972 /NCGR_PEP_ID=MMETSP1423-20130617/12946_1 /TAXON_ID=476441 /ORGANISM="Pseudo-nitzschia heimii, Strain UNC1101" /LENGTH=896 /DNA_ID=CAMNT_0042637155 /DNA_START=352 /DNA_END=3045 /DNA_ORIENTATION=+